jgi:alpha-tubulin suppressor-like RCC1 family protein
MCWGRNNYGQLGDGTTTDRNTAVDVQGLSSGVSSISPGYEHTCALLSTGIVKCWGSNRVGELGTPTTSVIFVRQPIDVTSLHSATASAISAGDNHTCAIMTAGGIKCWGYDNQGQLGNGHTTTTTTYEAVDVVGLSTGVSHIAARGDYTCAVTSDKRIVCWGSNDHGQLGDGTTANQNTPVFVSGFTADV